MIADCPCFAYSKRKTGQKSVMARILFLGAGVRGSRTGVAFTARGMKNRTVHRLRLGGFRGSAVRICFCRAGRAEFGFFDLCGSGSEPPAGRLSERRRRPATNSFHASGAGKSALPVCPKGCPQGAPPTTGSSWGLGNSEERKPARVKAASQLFIISLI